ncbi:Cas9 inhibitor AcrIIA9 family protein [Sphingobacterium sp. LRF_L2]|uniref:Cas9 inhibitor AcrIIA9 family protein n=1 Tax=Sphingobacterium sp. LRF_L2 TaxID=3369421 RepID=UPI003F5F0587
MKASAEAKEAIESHLQAMAAKDTLFAETLKKKNKSIDGCMNYIMSEAKKKGANMVKDAEVFGWAVHYYDEDSIKDTGKVQGVAMDHGSADPAEKAPVAKPKKKATPSVHQSSLFEL